VAGSMIQVTVHYDYTLLTPVLQAIFGSTVRVQAQATMLELT
jgi:hypothetical protein